MSLVLRPFEPSDQDAAVQAWQDFKGTSFDFLTSYYDGQPWDEYLKLLNDVSHGRNLPTGHVPGEMLAAVVNEVLVGRVSVRYELNEYLRTRGGHIGYAVIEGGYATEILRQALQRMAARGVSSVLLTCDDDNIGSATVIESQGGKLEKTTLDNEGVPFRRYWVAL
ncbi:MAG: GNAT family N-acetyltransferase [Acidimicrobiaceae bacterium]|nr:GNAT family N-acetyltransferase [Acidimicrobiaceae bacterium]